MVYYFTWNGTSSLDKGIRLQTMPEIIRPQERVDHVTIPGRAGELTLTEGENIFESYIQTLTLSVTDGSLVHAVEQWLRGDGYVTFCCQPEMKQRARVIGAVTLKKHSRNLNIWKGDVQFYCEPLKQALEEEPVEITSSGAVVENPGDVDSRPRITITGSGEITIRCGGRALVIPEAVSGWHIDSELEWITDGNNVPLQSVCSGEFPILPPGETAVQWTGSVTKLTIDGRWRYL